MHVGLKGGADCFNDSRARVIVRLMLPEAARMTAESDLHAIREMQKVLSIDGLMPEGSTALIEKFVAVSNPKLRAARVDIARIYTNEFASAR